MLMVFMSQPDFACNPHALWKYVKENTDFDTAWIVKKKNVYYSLLERGIRCAVYDTAESYKILSEADIIIANSYTFLNIPKRDDQLLVNLWHGSGVKAHDYYDHDLNPRHAIKLKNYFAKVDLMCAHSLDDRFKLAAMLNYDIRKIYVTGQPRLDCVTVSDGKKKLAKLFGDSILKYKRIIFFAPSYRANMSCHAGKIFSDNIFRVDDYDYAEFNSYLEKYDAALVYKLHPIEQTAFSGRNFAMNDRCYELTDTMLFDNDIRYDEFLNEFDVMVSDYSSIVYDFLLLDRPIVYLLPDSDEYKQAKGFVFSNIDAFMPGEKTADFKGLLSALTNAFENPEKYAGARKNVILNRFDYTDGKSTERCFRQIMEFHKISDEYTPYKSDPRTVMPSTAELLGRYIDSDSCLLIDSRKVYSDKEALRNEIARAKKAYYITGEIPSEFRSMSVRNSYKIEDLELYNEILEMPSVNVAFISGGVDYDKFSAGHSSENKTRTRIGFAGTIVNRIYFSMVHCICEEFPDCEIMFAGTIIGDYPAWLSGFDNLVHKEVAYNELPDIISSFDAAILPFFGAHCNTVPSELFQYLACGKNVVTSDMPNLPECPAIHRSASVAEVIDNIRQVLSQNNCSDTIDAAKSVAEQHSWENIAKGLLNDEYNFCVDNG